MTHKIGTMATTTFAAFRVLSEVSASEMISSEVIDVKSKTMERL